MPEVTLMTWPSWVTLAGMLMIVAVVVYTSVTVGSVRCEVCIAFEGYEACRSVDAATEAEAKQAAVTNTCAILTSGVTKTMACERTPPIRGHCEAR